MLIILLMQATVPCELDPFCDDPDGPIEAPLDDQVCLLLAAILVLILLRRLRPGKLRNS